jgi:hypothetical protein
MLVVALGWWGLVNLGSHTLGSQSDSLEAMEEPIYVAGCPVVDTLEKCSAQGDMGKGRGCFEEGSSTQAPHTSREWD